MLAFCRLIMKQHLCGEYCVFIAPAMVHAPSSERPKRRRVALNCLPCRIRKIKCDRTVPVCSSCQRRSIPHKCHWGDERDEIPSINEGQVDYDAPADPSGSMDPEHPSGSNTIYPTFHAQNVTAWAIKSHQYVSIMSSLGMIGIQSHEWSRHLLLFPQRRILLRTVEFYIAHVEPQFNCLNTLLLRTQLNQFIDLMEHSRRDESGAYEITELESPFWRNRCNWGFAAVVFALITAVCCNLDRRVAVEFGIIQNPDDATESTKSFFAAAMYFLMHSQYLENPTLWSLQAMVMLGTFFFSSTRFRDVVMWHTMTVRLALSMGLHRLGSTVLDARRPEHTRRRTGAPENPKGNMDEMASLDPTNTSALVEKVSSLRAGFLFGLSFEPDNLVAREIARKLWHGLVARETFLASRIDHCYMIRLNMMTTAPPADLDEEEVLRLDVSRKSDPLALERRLFERRPSPTSCLSAGLKLIDSMHRQIDLENEHSMRTGHVHLDYNIVQEIDLEARQVHESLPDYLRITASNAPSHVAQIQAKYPFLIEQAFWFQKLLHTRLLRLHFPFFVQGMNDTEYRHSAEVCVESARHIIQIARNISEAQSMTLYGDFIYRNSYFAAIVLHVANCCGNGSFASPELADDIRFVLSMVKRHKDQACFNNYSALMQGVCELWAIYFPQNETTQKSNLAGVHVPEQHHVTEDPLEWLSSLGYSHLLNDVPVHDELLDRPIFQ